MSFDVAKEAVFRDGSIVGVVFRSLTRHADSRGWLIELFRADELPPQNHPPMAYVSQTLPGEVRGPHEHRDQTDCFAFIGPGDFKLYLWDARSGSATFENRQIAVVGQSNRQSVIVPPGVIHAYKNISPDAGLVFNSPNRLYAGAGRTDAVDEIRHENASDCRFLVE